MNNEKIVRLPCKCGCSSAIVVENWWEDEISIRFESSYLGKENGRLKRALNAFKDKETCYAEVMCNTEEAKHFLKNALELIEEVEK